MSVLTTEKVVVGRCMAPGCKARRIGSKDEPPVGYYGTVERVSEDVEGVHSVVVKLFACTLPHLKKAEEAALTEPWNFQGTEQITYSSVEPGNDEKTIHHRAQPEHENAGAQANNAPEGELSMRFFIKIDRENDAYVSWSAIWGSPLGYGSRENMIEVYRRESGEDGAQRAEQGLTMADDFGSSSPEGIGTWTDDRALELKNGPGSPGTLARVNLKPYIDALLEGTEDGQERAAELVEFEDASSS